MTKLFKQLFRGMWHIFVVVGIVGGFFSIFVGLTALCYIFGWWAGGPMVFVAFLGASLLYGYDKYEL